MSGSQSNPSGGQSAICNNCMTRQTVRSGYPGVTCGSCTAAGLPSTSSLSRAQPDHGSTYTGGAVELPGGLFMPYQDGKPRSNIDVTPFHQFVPISYNTAYSAPQQPVMPTLANRASGNPNTSAFVASYPVHNTASAASVQQVQPMDYAQSGDMDVDTPRP